MCAANGLPLRRIEDGFIRSVGLGAGFAGAASLAVDARGIHCDATRPSDIEHMLQFAVLSQDQRCEGARIRKRIVDLRLSKYNLRGRRVPNINSHGRKIILVPGQVADDASVLRAMSRTIDPDAGESINLQLLRHVRARNPEAYLIFKPHPDVHFGLRAGGVPAGEACAYADVIVEDADIADLIDICDSVETISSLVGFEALLRDKPVTVHGLPFYAGWGATTDLVQPTRRTTRRTIDELCFFAFAYYTRHVDPVSGRECSIHALLDALDKLRCNPWHQLRVAGLRGFARLCERVAAKH
jgi:capsular polysaccharide export protein